MISVIGHTFHNAAEDELFSNLKRPKIGFQWVEFTINA